MTNEEAIEILKQFKKCLSDVVFDEKGSEAWQMAIKALSQVSEIEENIIKYMKKYPNHVGNTDFWEGFYACRNVVLQLDEEEYAPKEQEPCDAISRDAAIEAVKQAIYNHDSAIMRLTELPSVTQSGKWIDGVHAMGYREGYKDAQKQKSGRWKVHKKYYECSNCESQISNEFFVNYRFCPHCGARMESDAK